MTAKNEIRKPAHNNWKDLDEDDNLSKYNNITNELDAIYDHITEGIRIRSKCNWYEHTKKSTIFF